MNTVSGNKFFIETYGCQMNIADSEVVVSILNESGYQMAPSLGEADIILVNTCSVRENAETRVRGRLEVFRQLKCKKPHIIIGVIGCMGERLKEKLLEEEKMVDLVIGPDSYRKLPQLLESAVFGQSAVEVLLSEDETYADIMPVRYATNGVSAFVSIMRGCNNKCSYCIVPMTRGSERSRDKNSVLEEVRSLVRSGFRELTLIGQNVDSYCWKEENGLVQTDFSQLLSDVASENPETRIRFATSHPKDISEKLLDVIAAFPNIGKNIHLPVQSGSTKVLEKMNRKYTREDYLKRIGSIRRIIPDCTISTDVLCGFCGESEEDHQQTLSLMEEVGFDFAFMFKYSVRPGTYAADHYADDVSEQIKLRRLNEIIALQNRISKQNKEKDINKIYEVLAEGVSKKSEEQLFGRNSQNKVIVFPAGSFKPGDFVKVKVVRCTSATLIGILTEG